jgi:hypothetical protein
VQDVMIYGNQFSGDIPTSIAAWTSVKYFNFHNNLFTRCLQSTPPSTYLSSETPQCKAAPNAFACPIPDWVTACGGTCTL